MKKIILTLCAVFMVVMSFAQLSPLIDVEFYKAYLDVPIVKTASLANGKISNEMLDYIFKKANPSDVKYAIVNALGAKGKAAKIKSTNQKICREYVTSNYDNFNNETIQLFNVGTRMSLYYLDIIFNDYKNIDEDTYNQVVNCVTNRSDLIVASLIMAQYDMNPLLKENDGYMEAVNEGERMPVGLLAEFNDKCEKAEIKVAKSIKSALFNTNEIQNDFRKNAIDIVWNYFKEYDKAQATITIFSKSSNPYQIFINGEEITVLDGHKSYEYLCIPGYYHIKAVQTTGYIFNPTVNNRDVNITDGETIEITIGY